MLSKNGSNGQPVLAALYARVSAEEQVLGYSLDAQCRAFRQFCSQKGWSIFREYVEEGRSAHTENLSKRPVFLEAMADAEARSYDILETRTETPILPKSSFS